jgi:serine/threonine protein kinase
MKEINIEHDWTEFLQREYDILKILDHPFIMNLVEVYYSKKDSKMQLILPLYEGGDVYSLIQAKDKDCIPEKDVARILW